MRNVYSQMTNLRDKSSITVYCNKLIPVQNQPMKNFLKCAEPDGFIYFYIGEMEAFGSDD
jgi:hypothetical protein